MIEKLKAIFPDLTAIEQADKEKLSEYEWFQIEEEKFGIPKKELSSRETEILEALINPTEQEAPPRTEMEEEWAALLFKGKMSDLLRNEADMPFRYLAFTLKDPAVDPDFFKEAVHGFFSNQVPVLWENSQEGVIIEPTTEKNETSFYFDIAEVMMSDFYIDIKLAIGTPVTSLETAQQEYNWIKKWSAAARNYSTKAVIDYREVTPYLFLDQMDTETSQMIIDMVLGETKDNPELIRTIETFLSCNSNTTLAAKILYMHRNSLQYRVDKFIEQTGIDVKQFEGAVTVFLALSLLKKQ